MLPWADFVAKSIFVRPVISLDAHVIACLKVRPMRISMVARCDSLASNNPSILKQARKLTNRLLKFSKYASVERNRSADNRGPRPLDLARHGREQIHLAQSPFALISLYRPSGGRRFQRTWQLQRNFRWTNLSPIPLDSSPCDGPSLLAAEGARINSSVIQTVKAYLERPTMPSR